MSQMKDILIKHEARADIALQRCYRRKKSGLEGLGHIVGGIVGGLLTEVVVQLIVDRIKPVLNQDPKCPVCNENMNVNVVSNVYCNHCMFMQ
jgi:hypothetical protein